MPDQTSDQSTESTESTGNPYLAVLGISSVIITVVGIIMWANNASGYNPDLTLVFAGIIFVAVGLSIGAFGIGAAAVNWQLQRNYGDKKAHQRPDISPDEREES